MTAESKENTMNHNENSQEDRRLWKITVYFRVQPKPIRMDHVVYYTEDPTMVNPEVFWRYWASDNGKSIDHIEISIAEKWEA